jgi:RHS repeat-associated protein
VGQNTTTYSYDPASNLATVEYPNGLESKFAYDTLNRVTGLSNAAASYTYTLDGTVGNRKGVTEQLASKPNPRIVAWNYDNIYRLTNEDITADPNSKIGSVTYGLDPVGNRLSLGLSTESNLPGISPILPGSISYDQDDRLSTETYDFNGNTLTSGGKTFTYDFENRLKSMTEGTVTVTLAYDADGNRVAKTVNGVTTRYLVDDLNPTGYAQVVEEVTNGAVTRQYIYGLQRISQTQQIANAWTPAFYGYDGGGTVRLLTDATGTVTDTYDYDAWGNTVNTTGSTPNVYLYRGEQYDPDLGLYYLRARYFNPLTGRFLARDPAEGVHTRPDSFHKYLYGAADPINRFDPSGMAALPVPLPPSPGPVPVPDPAPQPRSGQGSGATSEYMMLVGFISLSACAALPPVENRIKCIWTLTDGWLLAAATRLADHVTIDAGSEDADSGGPQQAGVHVKKGGCNVCTYGCNVHWTGFGDHGGRNDRIESTVEMNSCAEACAKAIRQVNAAFAAFKTKNPGADHLQHCTEKGPWGGTGQCIE